MLKLLNRTLVSGFYQQHAGLFLVVLYLLFGAVEGSQLVSYHKALLLGISSSLVLLLIVLAIWLLYGIKCVHYINKKQNQTDHNFLQVLNTLPKNRQYQLWAYVYAMCFLPILIYVSLIVLVAIWKGYFFSVVAISVFICVLVSVAVIYTYNHANHRYNIPKTLIRLPSLKLPKPYWLWSLYYFLTDQKIALMVTKVVSLLFFKAILWVFADVGSDIKVYLTAMFAVVLSHAILLFNMVKFEANYLGFTVPLPIGKLINVKHQVIVLFMLLIPELLLCSWVVGFCMVHLLRAVLFSMGSLLFLKALVVFLKADMERYMKWLLFYFFVAMLAILASYDMLFSCCVIGLGLGYLVFNSRDLRELV